MLKPGCACLSVEEAVKLRPLCVGVRRRRLFCPVSGLTFAAISLAAMPRGMACK